MRVRAFNLKNMTREEAIKEIKSWDFLEGKEIEAIQTLVPELRESEDERMVREFNDCLCEEIECRTNDLRDEKDRRTLNMLCYVLTKVKDWLEKQKEHFRDDTKMVEQKPISTEDMPYITDEHFYERESADSFKYKLAEYMTKCCTKKEGPYGYTYGISAEAILKMAEEELLKRGVVQKSAENGVDVIRTSALLAADRLASAEMTGRLKERSEILENPEEYGLYKPASEEDDWKRKELIQYLEEKGDYRTVWMTWLKSLRPQPHKEIYQAAKRDLTIKFMNYLDENRPEGKMSLSNGECEDIDKAFKEGDWAKIIRYIKKYQPHWKPSDEQLRPLEYAIDYFKKKRNDTTYLESLYNDLKKLM